MSTDTDFELIDLAAKHIGATRYAGETRFAYTDSNVPGTAWLATDDDMLDLGRRLAAGEPDAYSHWCAATTADSVTAVGTVQAWREQGASFGRGVAGLRDDAANYADLLTVVACDLLREQVEDLLD